MFLNDLKSSVLNGAFSDDFNVLYGSKNSAPQRYSNAIESFLELYGDTKNAFLFSAPGRTEVGGNHTDHQHGCVLAGSVDLDVIAIAAPTADNIVRIKSEGYDMDVIDLSNLEPSKNETGYAISLIRGMCAAFKNAGYNIGGFNAYTTSNVLKGSGLSSSAAFEVLVGVILNSMFNDSKASAVDIAKFAQKAENDYFGKPCGLMDQMASSVGGFTAIDFSDPANPVIEKVDFDLAAHKYSLCIVNTGGNHADLTDDYAAVPAECKQIANAMGKEFLRDVDEDEFYKAIPDLRKSCSDRAVLRAIHFFSENRRAVEQKDALKADCFDEFLRLINESGKSSFCYLQNVFSSSAPDEQGISLALALTEKFLNKRGAFRVHGGGFAGTIQAFIPDDMLDEYKEFIETVFGVGSCYVLNIRPVGGYALHCNP